MNRDLREAKESLKNTLGKLDEILAPRSQPVASVQARRPAQPKRDSTISVHQLKESCMQEHRRAIGSTLTRLREIGLFNETPAMLAPQAGRTALLEQLGDAAASAAAVSVAQRAYVDPTSVEARAVASTGKMRAVVYGDWSVTHANKLTASGKTLVRYRVSDGNREFSHEFKYKEPASMVAAALNETRGRFDDPRVKRIVDLCEEEMSLSSDLSRQKRLLERTDPGNEKRVGSHAAKMTQAMNRLSEVRKMLGV